MNFFTKKILEKLKDEENSVQFYDDLPTEDLDDEEIKLFYIAKSGNTEAMQKLLKDGVNPNVKTEDGTTALMIAVDYRNHEVVRELLAAGSKLEAREVVDAESDGKGITAMNLAAMNKDRKMIELLLEFSADINERAGIEGASPFLMAVYSNDYAYMDFILSKGADVDIELHNGETALMYAILREDKKLANYLLQNGADVNRRNITGLTALEVAKEKGLSHMAEFLIEAGAKDSQRLLEHLVTYCQDFYFWDNDIAYAYYNWTTDDGFSHFLIYAVGYLNKYLAMSDLRRFYIRKKGDEVLETFAGDKSLWRHFVRKENGEVVDERFDSPLTELRPWTEIVTRSDGKVALAPDAIYTFEPAQSDEFDFDEKYRKLSEFLFQYVSIVKEKVEDESVILSVAITYKFSHYSKKGWEFLGPLHESWSVLVNAEHENVITDLLLKYFKY